MNRPQSESSGYVLKFISGKYQGGEFPVEMGQDIEIGRSSELDMVLVEDMVSRRHARITARDGQLEIEDFGSTNGTFVNGKKIDSATLEEGDRILIGTSIIKLVERDEPVEEASGELEGGGAAAESRQTHAGSVPASGATAPQEPEGGQPQHTNEGPAKPSTNDHEPAGPAESKKTQAQPAVGQDPMPADKTHAGEPAQMKNQQNQQPGGGGAAGGAGGGGQSGQPHQEGGEGGATLSGSISGLIEEVPLPDLLQLFSTSQKTGVLVVHHNDDVGKVYLQDGRVYYSSINDDPDIEPRKAFFRMLAWEEGTFSLEQATDESFEDEINDSVENLLMEGMKQIDEIRNLGDDVPDYQETLQVNKPLVPPLRSLSDELLDTLQLVYNYNKVATVLNKSLASDLETMEDIVHLIRKDYVSVEE